MDGIDHMKQGVSAKAVWRDPLSFEANVNGLADCLMTTRHDAKNRSKCYYMISEVAKNEMSHTCPEGVINNKNCINIDQWGEKIKDVEKYVNTNFPPYLGA